ncbi:hypothetical protein ARSEF4850_009224 [Beauveria asiatica]
MEGLQENPHNEDLAETYERLQKQYMVLADQNARQAEDMRLLAEQLARIQGDQAVTTSETPAPPPTTPAAATTKSRRKPLPQGEKYDGDRKTFMGWKQAITYKLEIDAEFIGPLKAQFMYIWANLSTQAQLKVTAYFEAGGHQGESDPTAFLTYLETVFGDPHRREIAMTKLNYLKQGEKEPFSRFFVRFEQELALAGGLLWNDEVKLTKLRPVLSNTMRGLMVSRRISRTSYDSAIQELRELSVDLESYWIEEQHRPAPQRGNPARQTDQEGDTPMSGINALQIPAMPDARPAPSQGPKKRANWVSDEAFRRRKETGVCLRCGRDGHRIGKCRLLPARPPNTRVNQVAIQADDEDEKSDSENDEA